jgi:hypothetical protein
MTFRISFIPFRIITSIDLPFPEIAFSYFLCYNLYIMRLVRSPAELTIHPWTKKAYEAEKYGFLPDWLNHYLDGYKDRPDLAHGIAYHAQGTLGPVELSISGLRRLVGPDNSGRRYDHPVPPRVWEARMATRVRRIEAGLLPTPLIIVDWVPGHEGYPVIGSGNHDHGALTAIVYMAHRGTALKIEPLIQPPLSF